MARRKQKTAGEQQKKFKWTQNMKVFLHVLHADFQFSAGKNAIIFKTVYTEEVLQHGLSVERLEFLVLTQIRERNQMRLRCWIDICKGRVSPADAALRDTFRTQIRDAAAAVNDGPAAPLSSRTIARGPATKRPARSAHAEMDPETPTPKRRRTDPATPRTPTYDDTITVLTPQTAPTPVRARRTLASYAYEAPAPDSVYENRRTAMVVLPKQSPARLPITPPKTRTSADGRPKRAYTRPDGTTIMLGEKNYALTKKPLKAVPEQIAHPPIPGLLFRYWNKQAPVDHNSENGFWARKYFKRNIIPLMPPRARDVDLTDILIHINCTMEKTPYISTASSLIWTLRKAIKLVSKGEKAGHLSIINPQALDPKSIFWVPPFHRATKAKAPFDRGAQHYGGTFEHLIWRDIPKQAIIHTISLRDLDALCQSDPSIDRLVRLPRLPKRKFKDMQKDMKLDKVFLDRSTVTAIAKLTTFMGINVESATSQISALVVQLVQGWNINLTYRDEKQWQGLAAIFLKALSTCSEEEPEFRQAQFIKQAFLTGIFWACGDDNPKFTLAKMEKTRRKASSFGLGNPVEIIAHEMDSIKMALHMESQADSRRIKNYQESLRALEGAANEEDRYLEDAENDEDMVVAGPSQRRLLPSLMDLDDKDEDEEDDGPTYHYHFGENGLLV